MLCGVVMIVWMDDGEFVELFVVVLVGFGDL